MDEQQWLAQVVYSLIVMANLTGYGTHATHNLHFDGNEEKYDMWECKFLSYMRLKKLKKVIVPDGPVATAEQREDAFAELVQFLDKRSVGLVMRSGADDGRKSIEDPEESLRGLQQAKGTVNV